MKNKTKKFLKRFGITLLTLFALLGAGTTVAFGAGYIQWAGSSDFEQVLVNLNLIEEEGAALKEGLASKETELSEEEQRNKDNEEVIRDLETERATTVTLVFEIITRANNANGKGNKFEVMREDTNALANHLGLEETVSSQQGNGPKSNQLKQAEEDMGNVKDKSQDVLDSFN